MRRYILGLSLVAFTAQPKSYLRQGCTLVPNPEQSGEFVEVYPDGSRPPCDVTRDAASNSPPLPLRRSVSARAGRFPSKRTAPRRDVKADEKGKDKSKRGKKAEASVGEAEGDR